MDLTLLFHIALDCGFFPTVTEDTDLGKYSTSILAFLQENRFHYFLNGIYWWECFRCQTVNIVRQCLLEKAISLIHYCSEYVNESKCSHTCCKLWLVQACVGHGIDVQKPSIQSQDGLELLTAVAVEKSKEQLQYKTPEMVSKTISK